MYADDTKISSTVSMEEEKVKLQNDLDRVVEWTDKWQLKFHTGKCKVIHLGSRNSKHDYTMKKHFSEESAPESH